MTNSRTATAEDFKTGNILIDTQEGFSFKLTKKLDYCEYASWEAKGTDGQGYAVIAEHEARFWNVKILT